MDLRRLRIGEWAAAACAVLLLVSLFLPWYERGGDGVSGWDALAVIDVFLAVVALAALALWALTAAQRTVAVPLALNSLLAPVAVVAAAFALLRLVDSPIDGASLAVGAWIGVLATVGLAAGTWVALRDERVGTLGGRYTDLTGRPVPEPPEPERLPPPPRSEPAT